MDIDIKCTEGTFKARACGVVLDGDKILAIKANWSDEHYCFAGGHIEIGEDSKEATAREMSEELQMPVKVQDFVCVNENIYRNKKGTVSNEIVFFYTVKPSKPLPKGAFEVCEVDHGIKKTQRYVWLDLNGEEVKKLTPYCVVEILKSGERNKLITTNKLKN